MIVPASLFALAALQTPASTPAGQGKVPAIQDLGEGQPYLLTLDETADIPDGMTLEAFVKLCQTLTDRNFTYTKDTAQVLKTTRLQMFGPKTIPKEDFYSFFQIMMIINDFVCAKIGPDHLAVILIQSLQGQGRSNVRNDAQYVQPEDIERFADQPATLITTVIDLPHTDVRTLSNSMRTMFTDANTQQIIPVGSSNSLIITGFGSSVASIVRMLRFVDEASIQTAVVPEFEVIPLEYASADELAGTVEELLEASRRAAQQRGQVQQAQGVSSPLQAGQGEAKILTDPRTNSLLVMAMPDDLPRIKELVAKLDVDIIERERTYHIYNLENVSAEDLAETLEDFLRDAGRVQPGGPGGAARPAQGQPAATGGTAGRNEVVVVPDQTTNSLLIAANRTRYDELLELVRQLDRRQDQVLIETALIELSGRDFLDLGVEIGLADLPAGQDGQFGVTSFGLSTFDDTNGDGIPDVRVPNEVQGITAGILDGGDFSLPFLVSALRTRTDTNVLNVPSVLVNNNGSARIVTKDEQPTTQVTANGVGGQTQTNFNGYQAAGITLQISPTISASRYLRLKVSLEVSNFVGQVTVGAIPPPKTTRTIDTTVNVPDGSTMVIGGIITDNKGSTHSGVPWLGDLPVIGALFRRTGDTNDKTTLYFFVTPHIMRDRDFADLAEISYKMKLEAADVIGTDRIQVIDPRFGRETQGVDLRGFELPLYRSPSRGEVDSNAVGLDSARMRELLQEARTQGQEPAPAPTPDPQEQKP